MDRKILLKAVVFSLVLNGCSFPHFYNTPIAQNVPLHDTCNQFTGLLAAGFGAVNQSFEGQASFSFPMNIALSASFLAGGTSHNPDGLEDYSKVRYFEGSAGYYKRFAGICSFEVYGGYGQGTQKHVYAYDEYMGSLVWTWVKDGNADISFSQVFIQPDLGVKYKWMEAALSCRLSRVNYDDISFSGTVHRTEELTTLKNNSRMTFLEPAFTLRAGTPAVLTQFQVVLSANLNGQSLLTEKMRINFGLFFTLGKQKGKAPHSFTPSGPALSGK